MTVVPFSRTAVVALRVGEVIGSPAALPPGREKLCTLTPSRRTGRLPASVVEKADRPADDVLLVSRGVFAYGCA